MMTNYDTQDPDSTVGAMQYLALLRNKLWLILIVTGTLTILALIISGWIPKTYETSTKVLVIEAAANKAADYNSILSSERLARTYSDVMMTDVVLDEVNLRMNLGLTMKELSEMINVAPVRDTQLIKVSVKGNRPDQIADIANMVVSVFIQRINGIHAQRYMETVDNLQTQLLDVENKMKAIGERKAATADETELVSLDNELLQYQQIYSIVMTNYEQARLAQAETTANVVQVNSATPPDKPVSPNILINVVVVALFSFGFMTGGIFLLDSLDDRLKTPEQIHRLTGLPILGTVHLHKTEEGLITLLEPRSPVSESFRSLRTSILYANVDAPIRTLLITSPSQSDGKTVVSTNLSVVMAQGDRKVILMDADMRRPTVHRRMHMSNFYGLSHVFVQPQPLTALNGSLQKTKVERLSIITAGDLPPNPAELLGSMKMKSIIDLACEQATLVVLDAPPVLPVADASILANSVDAILLVVRPGETKAAATRQAVEQLRRLGGKLIGVVINGVDPKSSRYSAYYQSSDYYYASPTPERYNKPIKREPVPNVETGQPALNPAAAAISTQPGDAQPSSEVLNMAAQASLVTNS